MSNTSTKFLADIDQFLDQAGIEATAFGKQAMGDPNFVFDLRKGRSPSIRTMDRVRDWMTAHLSSALHTARQAVSQAVAPTGWPVLETKSAIFPPAGDLKPAASSLTHLERLEAESIHIIREVAAESEKPVMLYSIGKDSAVMLHLAMKAFYPAKPPFPLMHVDTRWKFRDMIKMRDETAKKLGLELIVHINPEGVEKNISPFDHGSALHTQIMKTESLKIALDKYGFDAAFGGARRDEEKSRAKERIFSFRDSKHRWDPKNQRPELWNLYNARKNKGESIRVFPLSNWTELDIWQYIHREKIDIVPLYFADERPTVMRDGQIIMVDDDRMRLLPGEKPQMRRIRFRTLGCYPLTGAIESNATTLLDIVEEMLVATSSERQGRVIDKDASASMEKKKQEGYF
jgi:sulfate adenylyltransferase subunit 2